MRNPISLSPETLIVLASFTTAITLTVAAIGHSLIDALSCYEEVILEGRTYHISCTEIDNYIAVNDDF